MAVLLQDEARRRALASLKRFLADHPDTEVSDLQSLGLLDFFLKEIGPTVYNAGVTDAQAYLRDRLEDLEGACYETEFGYWPKSASVRRK
jgi:uncharacterized protein (DUF2164 family)